MIKDIVKSFPEITIAMIAVAYPILVTLNDFGIIAVNLPFNILVVSISCLLALTIVMVLKNK